MTEFVHRATLRLAPGANSDGPGGAITLRICGSWDHERPCGWDHSTSIFDHDNGKSHDLVVTFTADPSEEGEVRALIRTALESGRVDGPNGVTIWQVIHQD